MRLEGQAVLVTGGGSGLGEAVARAAAARGVRVAGIGGARRLVQKDGSPAPLEDFERVVRVNLVGALRMAPR